MKQELPGAVDAQHAKASEESSSKPRVYRDLLVFEYARSLFAVPASGVEGVVPFRTPVTVPGLDARVQGVIQDRGRIIMVLSHPAGRSGVVDFATNATRIVICTTARGLIGLPALATRAVGRVELDAEPSVFGVYESSHGAFTYLEPQALTESS
jgi:chemotaxis signal transduction protein